MEHDSAVCYEIIKGLIGDSILDYYIIDSESMIEFIKDDESWSIMHASGIFGECFLYHNGNIMADIDINDAMMVFTCRRGNILLFNVDLHNECKKAIGAVFAHLIACESMPAGS